MCLPEAGKVNNKEGRDVVGLAPQVLLPEALLPEPEALHVLVVVTERSEPEGCTLHVHHQNQDIQMQSGQCADH